MNIPPEPEPQVEPATPKSNKLLRLSGILFAVLITVLIFVFRNELRDLGTYGYLGIFLISMVGNATIILPVPTIVTAFAGGGIFNPVLVGIISAAGATIGELTGYLAGFSGTAIIEDRAMYDRFQGWMHRYGMGALFVLAAIPNPFFDVAGIIAGMSRLPVWIFLLVTWAGKLVKFLIVAWLGAGSAELLDRFL